MAICEHCGTEYSARSAGERYCCKGCEYVAELISDQGLDQFYDLKEGLVLAPVKSRPFEDHDFSWFEAMCDGAEAKAGGGVAKLDLGIEGISCVGCVWLIERLFERHDGAVRAVASPSHGRLHLEWQSAECEVTTFLRELAQFGYVAAPVPSGRGYERRRLVARLGLCGAFALNTMGFSLPVYLGMPDDFEFAGLFRMIAFLSATLSMLVGGGYFIDRAWRAVRVGSLHIDLPIALGLLSAYAGSIIGWAVGSERLMYFDFVSVFVFLMLGGRYLQTAAADKNRQRLMRQQPVPEVVDAEDGEVIDRRQIQPGLKFWLAPGRALPVSSMLVEGEADFSLEWIRGEADPVRFESGARLPGGAILLSRAPVLFEAGEDWERSLLSRLTAGGDGERSTPGLERILRWYLGVVLVLGVVAMLVWSLAGEPLLGLQAMISVFVVSCPCALGVAIPLADDLAASAVERMGVFVRNASLWPRLRQVRRIIFDKTGTLTLERPVLVDPSTVDRLVDDEALALVRLTHASLHPVSRALLEALGVRGQKLLQTRGTAAMEEFPGMGVLGDGWSLGRAGWRAAEGESAGDGAATELRQGGLLRASFAFREALRPDAVEVVGSLRQRGIEMVILSGDHPDKVRRMAEALEISADQAFGGLVPEQKAERVRALDCQDSLYLGDGANDSLAFDAAWVTGTPVVDRSLLEAKADFFTLGAGLGFLLGLLEVAEARFRAVLIAFGFAVFYNIVAVALAMAGHMSPLMAAVLMPVSSVVSILLVAGRPKRKIPIKG